MVAIAAIPHSVDLSPQHGLDGVYLNRTSSPSQQSVPSTKSLIMSSDRLTRDSDAMVEGSAPTTPAPDDGSKPHDPSAARLNSIAGMNMHAFTRARTPSLPRTSEEADDEGQGRPVASSSRSPSLHAQQRCAARRDSGTQGTLASDKVPDTVASTSTAGQEQASSSTEEDRRGRSISRQRPSDTKAVEESPRSRTPSPILGSLASSRGHLSFGGVALEPTPEEVRQLLYGEDGKDEERPADVTKAEMDSLEERLKSMGFSDPSIGASTSSSRESELAAMVKKILHHSQLQDHYIDSLEKSLHGTRVRSISTLSSMRTSFAHSFATEYELRARLEAELEDTRAQARKLSAMLARSENRNEEMDRERAVSAEEEVMWQEEMKDHAGAYAQQQAARARAAQAAQKGHSSGTLEASAGGATQSKTAGLDEPFQERLAVAESLTGIPKSSSDSNVFGLGISSPSQPFVESGSTLSPLSTIIKERNKLLADKRYLKARARDAEAQRDRLEVELKNLRPLLVRGAPSKKDAASSLTNTPSAAPTTPARSQKRDRSRRRRQAVLGDAEAEHLLLAARRLNMRPKEEVRPHTPPPLPAASNPRTPKTPRTAQTPRIPNTVDTVTQSTASTRMADSEAFPSTNASPLASRAGGAAAQARWGSHQRVDSNRSVGGIDDLLQAAQTVLTPEERRKQSAQRTRTGVPDSDQEDDIGYHSPARGLPSSVSRFSTAPSADASPKRRRVSGTSFEAPRRSSNGLPLSPDKSIFTSARRLRTSTEGAEPYSSQESFHPSVPQASQASALSALDLLADQATQSQQPSQSSELSGSGEGEPYVGPGSEIGSDDGMHVDHEMAQMHGMPPNGAHYYPRGAYGHPYAHPPPPISSAPMGHDGFRMMPGPQVGPYGYGPTGSPVSLSSQGWTSQTIPPSRNGLYSPPASQPRFALHSGPRITTGTIAGMGPGGHPLANSTPRMGRNGDQRSAGSMASDDSGEGEGDTGSGGGGGGGHGRTPQKGGNTSPDKRLPYVRWSDEEDAKLRKAIDEYGQRWELVARAVESRTYHQCRQRYLLMRRKDAAAREGMALSAAHGGSGAGNGSSGGHARSHSSSRPNTVSSPAG